MKKKVVFVVCFLLLIMVPLLCHCVNTPQTHWATTPYVSIQDKVYTLDANYTASTKTQLSADYALIGEVAGDAAEGCKAGETIFQSPDSQNEVYVYTALFSENGTYRYVRFVCE